MTEHKHKFSVDASCECGVMISELINQQEAKLEYVKRERDAALVIPPGASPIYVAGLESSLKAAKEELLDALSHVAEVAQGVTHYTHDEKGYCVRCHRDTMQMALETISKMHHDSWCASVLDDGECNCQISIAQKALAPTGRATKECRGVHDWAKILAARVCRKCFEFESGAE